MHLTKTPFLVCRGQFFYQVNQKACTDRALQACHTAIDIHDTILGKVKPGISAGELFDTAMAVAVSAGCEETFLGPPNQKVDFVGHGIGLELIEPPFIARGKRDILKPGMVFALEPKLCYKNEFAAGIESVFQVTDSGSRLISRVPARVFICDR